MNQLCKVCGEPAAGFHFGAFTCEGCKSFFGRTYNNISAIAGCKNNGDCVINKKNRTACKACRLRKCLLVGMSKSGSRYGRRSNWFKIHCLLQEQHSQLGLPGEGGSSAGGGGSGIIGAAGSANFEQLARLHQMQARQTYQDKTNPCIKSASMSPTLSLTTSLSQQAAAAASAAHQQQQQQQRLPQHYLTAAKFLNGVANHNSECQKLETRLSATPSDSGASSAGDVCADDASSTPTYGIKRSCSSAHQASYQTHGGGVEDTGDNDESEEDAHETRRKQFLHIFRSHSEPLKVFAPMKSPFAPYAVISHLPPPPPSALSSAVLLNVQKQNFDYTKLPSTVTEQAEDEEQNEPIDLSLRARESSFRAVSQSPTAHENKCLDVRAKPAPLDLTLVRTQTLTG